jgi:hypothetical protein
MPDATSWISIRAHTESRTLEEVAEFVETNESGIVAIDECDEFGNRTDTSWVPGLPGRSDCLTSSARSFCIAYANFETSSSYRKLISF